MMDWEKDMGHGSDDMEKDSSDFSDSSSDDDTWGWKGDSEYNFAGMKRDRLKLKKNSLNQIADILKELSGSSINFFAEDELCRTDMSMEVEGVGHLSFPLKGDSIEKLISISTKARFGKGEETILNEDVRDTHEISGKKLNVEINKKSFTGMLEKMRSQMGYSENRILETELHNMLIYSRGQFFDLHQDSEKAENMIGTLVIILPSPHIGGDLVIQHDGKEHTFSSENLAQKNFKCVGFYADCKHKIEKVRHGFRIALTYKLILNTKKSNPIEVEHVNEKLNEATQNYFTNFQTDSQKIVYFLDHSYYEHSLKWNMLKGADCVRGNALLAVGKSLGLTPLLSLVTIQYHWHNGDDIECYPTEDPLPDEDLCKIGYTLSHWINSNNETEFFNKYSVHEEEICWTKETRAFKPTEEDWSGYQGNIGLSVEYWYKRAAIVLWPASSDVFMKFILNPEDSFKEMQATMEIAGKENEIKEIVKKCGKELYCKCKNEKNDFEKMIQIALYIKDEEMALCILSHFNWSILNSDISGSLVELESQYGDAWYIDLLNKWKTKDDYGLYANKKSILEKLNNFVEKYVNCGGTSKVVKIILNGQFRKISQMSEFEHDSSAKLKDALEKYVDILYEFVMSCTLIENAELIDKIMQYLVSNSPLSLNTYLAKLYMKLRKVINANYLVSCESLKIYLINSIKAELAVEKKSKNNWSIRDQLKCIIASQKCKYCEEVGTFLLSKTENKKEWKLHKKHQEHISIRLKRFNLPVTLSVETKGGERKFQKVTLVKNESLHNDKSKKIAELQMYLKNLQVEA